MPFGAKSSPKTVVATHCDYIFNGKGSNVQSGPSCWGVKLAGSSKQQVRTAHMNLTSGRHFVSETTVASLAHAALDYREIIITNVDNI